MLCQFLSCSRGIGMWGIVFLLSSFSQRVASPSIFENCNKMARCTEVEVQCNFCFLAKFRIKVQNSILYFFSCHQVCNKFLRLSSQSHYIIVEPELTHFHNRLHTGKSTCLFFVCFLILLTSQNGMHDFE